MKWTEISPDFKRRPAGDLFRHMNLLSTVNVLAKSINGPTVIVRNDVWSGIKRHLESRDVELGGLLAGRVYENYWHTDFPLIVVSGHVVSDEYVATGVSLHMTTDVWNKARVDASSETSIVGWYHSHPNLGAFFSGTDRRTQRAFFREAHSTALVFDPVRGEQKWFIGPESREVEASQVLFLDP